MKINIFGHTLEVVSPKLGLGGLCEDCHFWHRQQYGSDVEFGHCRKSAPWVHEGQTRWPRTKSGMGCGQFRQRADGGGR